ncbi:Hypothetical predicted protein, partial [Pelobates cultripes]
EHILRASRNKAKPPEDYLNVKLFATLRRRRDFAPIVEILRANSKRYPWGFHIKMLVNKEGKMIPILSPEDGLRKLNSWGLENLPDERTATQHRRIQLEWYKTTNKR